MNYRRHYKNLITFVSTMKEKKSTDEIDNWINKAENIWKNNV